MRLFFLLFALLISPAHAAVSSSSQQEITRATLVSRTDGIIAGKDLEVGLLLEPKQGWHSYWENPGDAGLATEMEWQLPKDFSAGGIDWPVPQRIAEGPLVTFSYHDTVFLPVRIATPEKLDKGEYPIRVKATWLICKDICIPESAELELRLPVKEGEVSPSPHAPRFEAHDRQRPQVISAPVLYSMSPGHITLSIPPAALGPDEISSAFFFPRQPGVIRYASEQKMQMTDKALTLSVEKADGMLEEQISGILTVTTAAGETKAYDITLDTSPVPLVAVGTQISAVWFPTLLLFALLGGLILNLMPCVLPILSLKALAVVKKASSEPRMVVRQGIAYTLGILVSFAVLAGILISLQKTGEIVGWGYQMQSPPFVGFLIYLLLLIGLNLSGFFHLPVLFGNVSADIDDDTSVRGSFLTGVLATAVATPCTAPFMASAVGIALTSPPLQAMLIFEALGLGLALPFLMISLFPRLRGFLPRPGAWMETFKQILAFPMYASVIWLLWVLTLQTGAGGMAVVTTGMLALVMIIWMRALFPSSFYHWIALALFAVVLTLSLPALSRLEGDIPDRTSHAAKKMGGESVLYSKEALAELRAEGKAVFVDATAAWCITCQFNARTAILTARTMEAFKANDVTLMIADWTRKNDDITEFLTSFGYKGVPLYVYYPPEDGTPVVLPQLLTEDIVIEAIANR